MYSAKGIPEQSGNIVVYVLIQQQSPQLMVSDNFGKTWDSLNFELEEKEDGVSHIAVHPAKDGVYTVGALSDHLFQTKDRGESWIQIAESGNPLE